MSEYILQRADYLMSALEIDHEEATEIATEEYRAMIRGMYA